MPVVVPCPPAREGRDVILLFLESVGLEIYLLGAFCP